MQQLQWSWLPVGFLTWMGWRSCRGRMGGDGGGVVAVALWGWRQLMVRAPTGHTGASRWRTSEPPHSSTKNPANPGSLLLLPTQITHFSFCILLSSPLPPPWVTFHSLASSLTWSTSRFICYLAALLVLLTACLLGSGVCYCHLFLLRILRVFAPPSPPPSTPCPFSLLA